MSFCLHVIGVSVLAGMAACAAGLPPAGRTVLSARLVPVVRSDPRTGQMVRTVVVAPRIVASRVVSPRIPAAEAAGVPAVSRAAEVKDLVEETARTYEVSPELVHSVIEVESNYNPNAVSPKGAQGLMQLMPATARRFGVRNTFDPRQNIEGGVKYLKFLQETFKDDRLAIAAYNAGEAAVFKYGNVPPYAETMSYVAKVGKKYGQARRGAEARQATQNKPPAEPKAPEYRHLATTVGTDGRVYLTTQ